MAKRGRARTAWNSATNLSDTSNSNSSRGKAFKSAAAAPRRDSNPRTKRFVSTTALIVGLLGSLIQFLTNGLHFGCHVRLHFLFQFVGIPPANAVHGLPKVCSIAGSWVKQSEPMNPLNRTRASLADKRLTTGYVLHCPEFRPKFRSVAHRCRPSLSRGRVIAERCRTQWLGCRSPPKPSSGQLGCAA